jgi:hypothetical protein
MCHANYEMELGELEEDGLEDRKDAINGAYWKSITLDNHV